MTRLSLSLSANRRGNQAGENSLRPGDQIAQCYFSPRRIAIIVSAGSSSLAPLNGRHPPRSTASTSCAAAGHSSATTANIGQRVSRTTRQKNDGDDDRKRKETQHREHTFKSTTKTEREKLSETSKEEPSCKLIQARFRLRVDMPVRFVPSVTTGFDESLVIAVRHRPVSGVLAFCFCFPLVITTRVRCDFQRRRVIKPGAA